MILAGILCVLYCGNSLTPAINAARDAGPSGQERFRRLHRLSVRLNSVVLILGVALLVAFATRPAPQTPGIIEPSPAERARLAEEQARKARAEYEKTRSAGGTREKGVGAPSGSRAQPPDRP